MPPDPVEHALASLERSPTKLLQLWAGDSQVLSRIVHDERVGIAVALVARGELGADGVAIIARSPHLRRLRELVLSGCRIGDAGLAALATSPVLASVEQLGLGPLLPGGGQHHYGFRSLGALITNEIGDAGLGALAGCPHTGSLTTLDLAASQATDGGIAMLATSTSFPRLASLRLFWAGGTTPAAAEHVASARFAAQLVELDLGWCRLGDEGACTLARATQLGLLRKLALEGNQIGVAGASALAASRTLCSLEELDLRRNALGEAGVERFASRAGLPKLARIGLDENGLTTGRTTTWWDQGAEIGEGPEPISPTEIQRKWFRRDERVF